ncbi:undecaprenyl-diphosphate phosphatase [Natronomonas sp. EA1]|uniref:undecaprenyl-diphosphate phosphatase n=1 Tax=Natronomonas sp. EA1 TaxID=3421655 RepID=UPI003EC032CB
MKDLLLALLLGVVQGIVEWLPISSEGQIALLLTLIDGTSPEAAVGFALFLHAGTALSATVYYRDDLATLARERDPLETRFLVAATGVSVVVGLSAYELLTDAVSGLQGGAFLALIGVLLILTGVFQRVAAASLGTREEPTLPDALLVGVLQGLAVLPGVSRSGSTVGAMLVRGYAAPAAFRLSFILSIPAALGAGVLAALDGLPSLSLAAAGVAVGTAAVVGYASIDALLRVVDRVPFWAVCLGLGALTVLGGVLLP